MKLSAQYDVVCAGGGISNYLCAALLSKSGSKVLLLDENSPDISYPEALILSDLNHLSVFSEILKELEIHDLGNNLLPLDAVAQVISPSYRLVLSHIKEITKIEIDREFLDDAKEVHRFFDHLYQMQHFDDACVKKLKKKEDAVEKLALALLGSLSHSTPCNLGTTQMVRTLALGIQKRSLLAEGVQGLKIKLLKSIQNFGGHVKYKTTIKSIINTRKKITGVLLSSHEGIVESKVFILGNKLLRTYLTLPESLQQTSVLRQLRKVNPTHWRYTFSIEVPNHALPVGVTQHMIIISSFEKPLEEENFLKVLLKPHQNSMVTIFVTALLPYKISSVQDSYLRIINGRILHILCHVMPFLEKNMIKVDRNLCHYDNGLDDVPEHLLQYYVQGAKGTQDFWGVPWISPHPNLYFTGRQIWPSLGFTGEVLSAKKIFDDIRPEQLSLQGGIR